MNDEQRDLARRLADAIRYRQRPPEAPQIWRRSRMKCVRDKDGALVPDLTDAATGGVLLDMLGPGWVARCDSGSGGERVWSVWDAAKRESVTTPDATLALACARALLAEWGEA